MSSSSTLCKSFLRAAKLAVLGAAAGVAIILVACEEAVPQPAPTPTTPQQPTDPEPTPPQPTDPQPTPPAPSVDRGLGLQFMDTQAYRSAYVRRAEPVSVPSSVDLSADNPPPGDQGRQGSCVGWAVAYAMKSYQERIERDWPLTNNGHVFSPAYVYNQIKLPGGGAYMFDAFSLLVDQGVASLATMPYNPNDDRTQPGAAARREAADYKIADWGVVLRTSHTTFVREIKRHLAANTPVVIGIHTYPDFFNLDEANPVYDDASGFSRGGHAIVIVGYDDARSAFKIINSWGTDWGLDGYGWIDYDASERLIRVAYTADDVVAADVNRRPEAASTPVPDNTAEAVAVGDTTTPLSWTRNERTTSFDVYVGTDSELGAVDFQGNVAQPTFSAKLAPGSTYYWRIDARGAGGLTQGQVWSFTTAGSNEPPLKPTNPNPTNGATAVSGDVSLSWDSGGRATSYDVYLGTDSSLGSNDLQRTQAVRTFYPGTLVAGTRYYWRIDAKNSLGTTRGDTWSFTTEGPAPTLSIADASATEGQSLSFALTLSAASGSAVTVDYRSANGTAVSPSDYRGGSGRLRFAAGVTRRTLTVRTIDDRLNENNETFTVSLSNANGATISDGRATGTIIDNDGTLPSLSIADASATEGQSLSFTVTLSAAAASTVTVQYRTSNGTASSSDYTSASGTLRFSAGDTSKTISVRTTDDRISENNETITVSLSNANGATISDDRATGTINDNDGTPSLSIADASATEGQSLSFAVTLSAASSSTVTVQYRTSNGTASSSDYTSASGTLRFSAGDTSKTISVRTTHDTRYESHESLYVRLSSASGATISDGRATGRIIDNDRAPLLSIADASATEGRSLAFVVTLSAASGRTVTVQYRTANGTASSSDYTSANGTLRFSAGDTRKTISVRTTDDTRDESNETITVTLSSASGATISDGRATGTIIDNDDPPDHGDNRNGAHQLSNCGSSNRDWTINGSLTAGDKDYFKLVCESGRGNIRAWTTGSTDTYGYLRYGDDSIADDNDNHGPGDNFRLGISDLVGTYYVEVRGRRSTTTGSYSLHVQWRPDDVSDSINDGTSSLRPGSSRPLYLYDNDEDWLSFILHGSGCADVHITSSIEPRVRRYFTTDPDGELRTRSGVVRGMSHISRGHIDIEGKVRKGSTRYWVRVWERNGNTGPYVLTLTTSNTFTCIGAKN